MTSRRRRIATFAAALALPQGATSAAADPAWRPAHPSHDGAAHDVPVHANRPRAGAAGAIERIVLIQP